MFVDRFNVTDALAEARCPPCKGVGLVENDVEEHDAATTQERHKATTIIFPTLDHGNYVPSSDLTKAVTQASRYIYEVEREANSVKFVERMGGVRTVKPRCTLVFGRSSEWNLEQAEAYRIMNAGFHNLSVLTYDHVLTRPRRIVGIED